MLAVDIANEERVVGIMDIGTNTELILGNGTKSWRPPVRLDLPLREARFRAACPDFRARLKK